MKKALPFALIAAAAAILTGCDKIPGKPTESMRWHNPKSITDFHELFTENCQGCHGFGTQVSGAIALDNPTYLAVVSDAELTNIITNGVPKTRMPAFSEEHGGMLTDKQIGIIVQGIRAWAKNPPPPGMPPYAAPLGNAQNGAAVFSATCGSCHGADGHGVKGKAGSVVDAAYLGLVSDQYLRTITIAGRNDLGCPDFQNRVPGRAMTNEEISDVVAWLASQRKNEFGQPLLPAAAQN